MFNHAVRWRLLDATTLRGGYDNGCSVRVVAVDTHEALEEAARLAWSRPGKPLVDVDS